MARKSSVPLDAPSWIDEEFIEETLRFWQPYSKTPLTRSDAIEIIVNVTNLYDFLSEPVKAQTKTTETSKSIVPSEENGRGQ